MKQKAFLFFIFTLLFSFFIYAQDNTQNNACIKIVKLLTPKASKIQFRISAYAKLQKDIQGQSQLEAPVNTGIRIDIPIYDTREKLERQKEYLKSLNFARRLIADYIKLRYEVEEMKKYIAWQWQRVEAGIEYRKHIWKEEIKLKQKKGELKALTSLLIASGIPKNLLDKCYKE